MGIPFRRRMRRASHTPLLVRLLGLYPAAWQERYGEELSELLAVERCTLPALCSVLFGAMDAQLHPTEPNEHVVGSISRATERLRATALTTFCAYCTCLAAGLAFFEIAHDVHLASLRHIYPALTLPWTLLVLGILVALAALLAGSLPILIALIGEVRRQRPHDARLLAVPPAALLLLGTCDAVEEGLRMAHVALPLALAWTLDVVFHALFGLAVTLCLGAMCMAVARSTVTARLFRSTLAPAAVGTLGLGAMVLAALVWLVRLRADAPHLAANGPLAIGFLLLVLLMLITAFLAAVTVARGLAIHPEDGDSGRHGTAANLSR